MLQWVDTVSRCQSTWVKTSSRPTSAYSIERAPVALVGSISSDPPAESRSRNCAASLVPSTYLRTDAYIKKRLVMNLN